MGITLKGGDGKNLAELIKKLSNAKSVEVGWNEEARYPSNHRNGGDFVANVAAINEYGSTVLVPAHKQTIYRSINEQSGEFKRGARFVKSKSSNYETEVVVPAHVVTIPPRPFFRTMIARNRGMFGPNLAKALVANDYDARRALNVLGTVAGTELKQTIDGWTAPSNAASTVARKGFNDPLHESGELANTVNHWVK
jgi:hypothetical protein